MRFVSFSDSNDPAWGFLTADGVVDSRALGGALPASLMGFVQQCEVDSGLAARTAGQLLQTRSVARPVRDMALQPCIPAPGKIICLGVNYHDHAKEGGNTVADYPALFLRCDTSLLAHGAPLKMPRASDRLDYEAELAVVIGRRTRFVSEGQALDAVFGYACFNDVSLRDYQRRTTQWSIGKNFDGTGGFGPCLVTADELPPGCMGLRIQSRLNGKVMQDADTADMVFGVARTISLLSQCLTLEAGDVLVMGTPGGVGYARNPPVWMKAGDTIEVDIEGIGVLSNLVVA